MSRYLSLYLQVRDNTIKMLLRKMYFERVSVGELP